ncbi:MAG: glycosyltransferase family 4 protein [Magnetospirillum sp.]|nr:glycosyltransferase family 4 protein [Magnetospirillum sp.]
MRIAEVAPLYEAVPPKLYGGTERVVSYLTEELVVLGHHVTLFASADSVTSARLVDACAHALRLEGADTDSLIPHVLQLESVMARADEFDVIHFHADTLHYPFARRSHVPVLTTLHGRQDVPGLAGLYREFDDVALISISNAQRSPVPWVNWIGTVHHGLPAGLLRGPVRPEGYLAFIGRFSPEKRFDRAVAIARAAGLPLKAAAKADVHDSDYFERVVQPLLDDQLVDWVGEIGEGDKEAFLGGALAHLFPIDWPEPFGLVMVEAMACGTPTIAWPCGSVPEVIEDGVTGYVVDSVEAAVAAVERCRSFDRHRCRQAFERRFTARRMAADYLALYQRAAASARRPSLRRALGGLAE